MRLLLDTMATYNADLWVELNRMDQDDFEQSEPFLYSEPELDWIENEPEPEPDLDWFETDFGQTHIINQAR